ncbi:hypothetical protein SLEP1_g25226 [Rubroshorea leprosula]|uniref:Uncharacterized protein n=1 Tax=Rubroshorea leprosula TaxID=152421 RepID=A0AAV5JQE2_9ROSI|nr:hypothetical protein SLEP1_g25226 [Rubroshorea leprosula]
MEEWALGVEDGMEMGRLGPEWDLGGLCEQGRWGGFEGKYGRCVVVEV